MSRNVMSGRGKSAPDGAASASRKRIATHFLLAALAFVATATGGTVQLPPQVQQALTSIDSVPTPGQLDTVFTTHAQALTQLSTIALDGGTDIGIRLRAIHALTKYCTPPCADTDTAHQALTQLITANRTQPIGAELVMLRGAIEAIGPQRVPGDVTILTGLLDHPSRDIRAATAHALRDLCNISAINPLRVRAENETTEQVKLAINEALRILGQPTPCQ